MEESADSSNWFNEGPIKQLDYLLDICATKTE